MEMQAIYFWIQFVLLNGRKSYAVWKLSVLKYKFPETENVFTEGSRWTASSFVSISPIRKSVLYLNYFSLSLTSKDNHMQEHLYYITEYLALAWELSYKKLNALLHICGLLQGSVATHILWKGKENRDAREMMRLCYGVR